MVRDDAACEFTIRADGQERAVLHLDQFGNYHAEVLESVTYDIDVAYATQHWAIYYPNGCGEWMRQYDPEPLVRRPQ